MRRRALTALDALLVTGLLAGNGALAWKAGWAVGPAASVEVISGDGTVVLALDRPRRLEARGPLGVTMLRIGPDGVQVESSPCPNHLCIRAGRITHPGQAIACLPNRVAVRLKGYPGPEAVDAVAR